MQNTLNTQKSNFSDVAVSAHSKVTSAIRKNDLGTSTKSCSNIDIKQEKVSSDYDKRQSHRSYVYALRDRASDILHEPKKLLKKNNTGFVPVANIKKILNKVFQCRLIRQMVLRV